MVSQGIYCVVLVTCSEKRVSQQIIHALMDQRLAACVQIQDIESHYRWEGKIEHRAEKLLFIKTRKALYAAVEATILAHHHDKTPEIIQLPISDGLNSYLQWIEEGCI